MHVFAFSATGETLLVECEGDFNIEQFNDATRQAQAMTVGLENNAMATDESVPLQVWLRQLLEEEVKAANHWRQHL